MTRFYLLLFFGGVAILAGSMVDAHAMIDVSCRIDKTPALLQEAVNAEVKITNRSGSPLQIDPAGGTRLRFIIERRPGHPLRPKREVLAYDALTVPPGRNGSVTVDLTRSYDLTRTGPYVIRAMLVHQGHYFQAPRALLDVVPGFEVLSMTTAVPGQAGQVRKYSIRSLMEGLGQSLFLRIDDPVNHLCFGVIDLGRTLAGYTPRMETGPSGRVHVLHQSGPTRFTYSVFGPNAAPLENTFYTRAAGNPDLRLGEDGEMEVTGVMEYEGDASASRPVIRPFDPFE